VQRSRSAAARETDDPHARELLLAWRAEVQAEFDAAVSWVRSELEDRELPGHVHDVFRTMEVESYHPSP